MKTIKHYDDFTKNLNEKILNEYSYKDLDNFLDDLYGKKVSFFSDGKEYIEVVNDIEMTPDEEDKQHDYSTYNGDVWINDKKVQRSKEIKIIE